MTNRNPTPLGVGGSQTIRVYRTMNNQQLPGHTVNSDNPLPDLLVRAVVSGHLETVNYLLSKGVDPDAACKHGYLALYLAAFHGHCDVVQALLVKGAAINGSRALIAASLAGSLEIVELLLAHGADPNIQFHHNGYTALHWAAISGHPDIVIALLNKGASIKATFMVIRHLIWQPAMVIRILSKPFWPEAPGLPNPWMWYGVRFSANLW